MDIYPAKLIAVPDNTTKGSEGRLCLQLPDDFKTLIDHKYRTVGHFKRDGVVMLVPSADGSTVTPRRQYWWKNGVRDHGIRVNWHAHVSVLENELIVVQLVRETGEEPKHLPPYQDVLFNETM